MALPDALAHCRVELRPASTEYALAEMAVELGRFLRLGHGNGWRDADRQEWIRGVMEEFRGEPYGLVVDAISAARREVEFPGKFVPWVLKRIAPDVEKLRLEESRLAKLAELAAK